MWVHFIYIILNNFNGFDNLNKVWRIKPLLQSSKTPQNTHISTTKMGIHFAFHFLRVLGILSSILRPLSCLLAHSLCHMSRLGSKHVDNVSWHQKLQIMWRTNSLVQWLCFKNIGVQTSHCFMLWGAKDIDFTIYVFKGEVCASCSNPIILYNLHGEPIKKSLAIL